MSKINLEVSKECGFEGTTSNKYRAELYDEVWNKARSMGYANVTDALCELLPLQRQVAMLHSELHEISTWICDEDVEAAKLIQRAICSTQATAEAYDREHAAKVLLKLLADYEFFKTEEGSWIADAIRDDVLELRATKQVKE